MQKMLNAGSLEANVKSLNASCEKFGLVILLNTFDTRYFDFISRFYTTNILPVSLFVFNLFSITYLCTFVMLQAYFILKLLVKIL